MRPPQTHVVLLDGTMSSLRRGYETNIGLTYRLLLGLPSDAPVTVYYEPGIQWRGLRRAHEVIAGIGINRQIRRAYLFLARNYRPGDRIILMGFSRGAYAVRSLAGLIDTMGLLRPAQVDEDTLDRVYDCYRHAPQSAEARALRAARCHERVTVDFLGVYDTVRALGIRWPILWRLLPMPHPFHSHILGPSVRAARQALALDETRDVYAPVMWTCPPDDAAPRHVQQMWFRGTHGDVGGQIDGWSPARGLSNIPLVWMLQEAEAAGLPLPMVWRHRYVTDATAPSIGTFMGAGKYFLLRHRRHVGLDPSEYLHPSARPAAVARGLTCPTRHPPRRPFQPERGRCRVARPAACAHDGGGRAGARRSRRHQETDHDLRRIARRVASALRGSSGQGCLGYCARISLRTSA
ncbi:peptidoglycan binding protein domain protein [Roseibacterium elongatum DSM 19469]|uniref:Peptidoglycan binding protein domain protein n=1 Tax=Roseicyclus elongatus DSM 19469 TaxID=1294273 RepID=W8RSN9_9RHOB|nr:DUF2235 domain-containing protein [Roseibacterium elongatum]AHM04148.1 peptidoglycan binding protein domain protein [Roseibacterium elongatum DSM 19469]